MNTVVNKVPPDFAILSQAPSPKVVRSTKIPSELRRRLDPNLALFVLVVGSILNRTRIVLNAGSKPAVLDNLINHGVSAPESAPTYLVGLATSSAGFPPINGQLQRTTGEDG